MQLALSVGNFDDIVGEGGGNRGEKKTVVIGVLLDGFKNVFG